MSVLIWTGSIVASGNSRSAGSTGSMMTSSAGAEAAAEGAEEAEVCACVMETSRGACGREAPEGAAGERISVSGEEFSVEMSWAVPGWVGSVMSISTSAGSLVDMDGGGVAGVEAMGTVDSRGECGGFGRRECGRGFGCSLCSDWREVS